MKSASRARDAFITFVSIVVYLQRARGGDLRTATIFSILSFGQFAFQTAKNHLHLSVGNAPINEHSHSKADAGLSRADTVHRANARTSRGLNADEGSGCEERCRCIRNRDGAGRWFRIPGTPAERHFRTLWCLRNGIKEAHTQAVVRTARCVGHRRSPAGASGSDPPSQASFLHAVVATC